MILKIETIIRGLRLDEGDPVECWINERRSDICLLCDETIYPYLTFRKGKKVWQGPNKNMTQCTKSPDGRHHVTGM